MTKAQIISFNDYPQTRNKMKIPLQTEISRYMAERMGWNEEFCKYYAEKFWNYYNAQGWKLSNGNSMKDWRSAFNSQWQKPRFQDDLEMLKQTTKKQDIMAMTEEAALGMLDAVLLAYKNGFKPEREDALKIYEWLKQRKLISLPKNVIEEIRIKSGNNNDAAKLWALKYILENLNKNNVTFTQLLK